jgi:hypothetical protein
MLYMYSFMIYPRSAICSISLCEFSDNEQVKLQGVTPCLDFVSTAISCRGDLPSHQHHTDIDLTLLLCLVDIQYVTGCHSDPARSNRTSV